jgi:hypothetical protein
MRDCIEVVFDQLYSDVNRDRNRAKKMAVYESIEAHPFLTKILEFKAGGARSLDAENSKCDEVFADYVLKMSQFCNLHYFIKLLKFITLFRECVNIINREKLRTESREFCEVTNAEDVPDVSNEFITEFLDPDTNIFDICKEEAIDLTQNFCHWLYENNFTCSKLSLISNY